MKHISLDFVKTVNTRLIIDGDIPVFAAAAAVEQEITFDGEQYQTVANLADAQDAFIDGVARLEELLGIPQDRMVFCFSGTKNFRKGICPSYKANRKSRKPMVFRALMGWVMENYGDCRQEDYLEGDDMVGLTRTPEDIMVSSDKDLLTVPGIHFNPQKNEACIISEAQSRYYHALQTLTGDSTDNYPGCPGVGPVRAAGLLDGVPQEDYWAIILKTYEAKGLTRADALMNARCAYILHKPEDYDFATQTYYLWTPNE